MYHPAAENEVKYEDTMPLPLDKPETAEKLGHQLLKKHNMNDVDIEAHYHSRSYPTPEGYDVQAVGIIFVQFSFFCKISNFLANVKNFIFSFLICFPIALEKRIAEILCPFPRDWLKFIIILPGLGLSTDGPSKIGLLLTVLEKDVASAILKNDF